MDNATRAAASPTVVVVTGGDPPDPAAPMAGPLVPPGAWVIAADSGADTASALGLAVDQLVGDLDSVSPAALAAVRSSGAAVERHQADKDSTDLELALDIALTRDPSGIVVLGGLGGRIDHELANVQLLAATAGAGIDVVLLSGAGTLHFLVPGRRVGLRGTIGDIVTLVPAAGVVQGVTTEGLRWPLDDAVLVAGTTLGVSNELVAEQAAVACTTGVLLVIQPGMAAAAVPPRSTRDRQAEERR